MAEKGTIFSSVKSFISKVVAPLFTITSLVSPYQSISEYLVKVIESMYTIIHLALVRYKTCLRIT